MRTAWVRAWPGLAGRCVVLLLSAGTCVFGLVLIPRQLGALQARALAALDGSEPPRVAHAPGWLVIAQGLVTSIVMGIAAALGERTGIPFAPAIFALLGAMIVNAAWAPIALAPVALIDGESGVAAALVRSFELSARCGPRRTIALGVQLGGLAGLAAILPAAIAPLAGDRAGALSVIVWFVVAMPVAALQIASAYRDAKSRPAYDGAHDPRVLARLRAVLLLVAPATLALAVALVVAALSPTDMQRLERAPEMEHVPATDASRERFEIPGEHGLVVCVVPRGVAIETADGGGAGIVEGSAPYGLASEPELVVGRTSYRGQMAWVAVLHGRWAMFFDDEGVRLDDSISDRVATRMSGLPSILVLLALGLALALAKVLSRSLEDARALDAPRWSRETPVAKGSVARIDGVLRLPEGAHIALARGRGVLHGDAHVDAGDVRIALPSEVPLLAMDDVPLNDGDAVTIVAATDTLHALGPRQGSVPFPPGGRLVPGDRDHAAERVLGRAARSAALLAVGIAAALGVAALKIALAS